MLSCYWSFGCFHIWYNACGWNKPPSFYIVLALGISVLWQELGFRFPGSWLNWADPTGLCLATSLSLPSAGWTYGQSALCWNRLGLGRVGTARSWQRKVTNQVEFAVKTGFLSWVLGWPKEAEKMEGRRKKEHSCTQKKRIFIVDWHLTSCHMTCCVYLLSLQRSPEIELKMMKRKKTYIHATTFK